MLFEISNSGDSPLWNKKQLPGRGRCIGVYPGQYYDAATDLHYNWHRYYNPETGRYITADPIGLEGGINLFTYASNGPVNSIDPNGLETFLCHRPLAICDKERSIAWHKYICVRDGVTGQMTCSSTTADGGFFFYTKGRPTTSKDNDEFDPKNCRSIEKNNPCMDQCVKEKLDRPDRPQYGWPGPGMDCKEYSDAVIVTCRKQCFLMNDYSIDVEGK